MSAEGIFANLAFSVPIGLLMLVLFAWMRTRLPLFYHRNILSNGKAVLGLKIESGFFGWVRGILRIEDDDLLRLGGFDTVVTSNGLRLVLLIICVMTLPCLLVLAPYYYYYSDHSDGITFNTFTIADLYTDTFWPPLLVLVFLTFLVLYTVYAFFANYVKMRQAYLLRPSSLDCLGSTVRNAEAFGSLKYSRQRADAATCTVLLHPLPDNIRTADDLRVQLQKSGILGLENVQIIGNFGKLQGKMGLRNSSLYKLENALQKVCEGLTKADKQSKVEYEALSVKERGELFDQLISDVSFCAQVRPRHKTSSPAKNDPEPTAADGTVDSIRHFYKKLKERDAELQAAIEEFNHPDVIEEVVDYSREEPPSTTNDTNNNNDVDSDKFEERFIEETTFISWKKISNVSAHLPHMRSISSTRAALLSFNDYREAGRAQQILLTSKPNEMATQMAPGLDDIIWGNLGWSERNRWHGVVQSNLRYWLFLILFAPLTAFIVSIIDLKSLGQFFPSINEFRQTHPHFREILQSVLAPFLATLLVKRTGMWICGFMMLRGPMSKSELLARAQSGHIFFLFFQVILIGSIFSNVYKLASSIAHPDHSTIVGVLRDNIPKKSHFFFNFMIQDIFNELMLELLNPKSLLFYRRSGKSLRQLVEMDTEPPELESAFIWSRFIVFPYFIMMTYAIISPLIILPALGYFAVAYFVFRFRFAQFCRRSTETGGILWSSCARQIIYGLLLAQLSVLLQYTQFRRGILPSLIIILLFIITIGFIPFIQKNFDRGAKHISFLEDEAKACKESVKGLLQQQNKQLPQAVESLENSSLIKSSLEADLKSHLNFSDIDPNGSESLQVKAIEEQASGSESETGELFKKYWTFIPINFSNDDDSATSTFDPYQVDRLVDCSHVKRQYEHPLILKHHQVLLIPSQLPMLLKNVSSSSNKA